MKYFVMSFFSYRHLVISSQPHYNRPNTAADELGDTLAHRKYLYLYGRKNEFHSLNFFFKYFILLRWGLNKKI